jgi:hypothetical protein
MPRYGSSVVKATAKFTPAKSSVTKLTKAEASTLPALTQTRLQKAGDIAGLVTSAGHWELWHIKWVYLQIRQHLYKMQMEQLQTQTDL